MDLTKREKLVNRVLKQIERDLESQDVTALEVLLESIPDEKLESYVSESEVSSDE